MGRPCKLPWSEQEDIFDLVTEGATYAEIAENLGVSAQVVASAYRRVARSREREQQRLEEGEVLVAGTPGGARLVAVSVDGHYEGYRERKDGKLEKRHFEGLPSEVSEEWNVWKDNPFDTAEEVVVPEGRLWALHRAQRPYIFRDRERADRVCRMLNDVLGEDAFVVDEALFWEEDDGREG